jgi:hypothetical protein
MDKRILDTLGLPPATVTPTPTLALATKQSMGTPIPPWEGLPIMPGAMDGKLAGLAYVYSVLVPVFEAETFYRTKMAAGNWILSNRTATETSMLGGPAVRLDFTRDGIKSYVMLIFSPRSNVTMVMLVKGNQ